MGSEEVLHPFQCAAVLPSREDAGLALLLASRDTVYKIDVEKLHITSHWRPGAESKQAAIVLLVTAEQNNLAAVATGEDKTVHILEADNGVNLIRSITLPKRPCALSFTSDSGTLLCGDKFGDVYAIPSREGNIPEPMRKRLRVGKREAPGATNLTVHTKGNLYALEQQRKLASKAASKQTPSDESLKDDDFPYEPVVGHVSMLTDIVAARGRGSDIAQATNGSSGRKDFIITADRDEHIRISRGLPQSHVIHRFCLGHRNFVSKLCLLKCGLLVSGGGDSYLCVWDWETGNLLTKLEIQDSFTPPTSSVAAPKVAVSGLWDCSNSNNSIDFVCACEGSPRLLHVQARGFSSQNATAPFRKSMLELDGNPLDVAFLPAIMDGTARLVVCLDGIHLPGSIKTARDTERMGKRLQVFESKDDRSSRTFTRVSTQLAAEIEACCDPPMILDNAQILTGQLAGLLYGTENLRKREVEGTARE
ncbi:MAG: hypothetical protein Q9159_000101 [Coniocarpon cinnabarinum]